MCGFVLEREYGQITHIQGAIQVADADVEGYRHRVVADVGRVVAGSASARHGGKIQVVVQTRNTADYDRLGSEDGLAARDAGPAAGPVVTVFLSAIAVLPCTHPGIEQIEDDRRKRGTVRIPSERVIDSDEEGRHRMGSEHGRPPVGAIRIQGPGPV